MTNRLPKNPFLISGYASKAYFCDREKETKQLHSALQNERNVVLISPRRMGKTGLISHLFASIPDNEAYCIYVDLYKTTCLREFVECLAKAIVGNCGSSSIREKIMLALQSLRFSFTSDPITGVPEIGVNLVEPQAEVSLQQIFTYMEHADKPVYVALDEFQQIQYYPDSKVEETLPSYIQHLRNTHFIFAGSQKHMMMDMFSSAKRAFFQSAQTMHIDAIPEDVYFAFCRQHFHANNQEIKEDAFHFLYTTLYAHTWYVQSVLNRLYESKIQLIDIPAVQEVIQTLVNENAYTYQNYCRLFTINQLATLKAIAIEREVKEPNNQAFIMKHHLSAASTIRSVIKTLVEKEFIYEETGVYSVYDRFFGIWLSQSSN
jgi:hypothetical protein